MPFGTFQLTLDVKRQVSSLSRRDEIRDERDPSIGSGGGRTFFGRFEAAKSAEE
jgi:hypothetical protein